MRLASFCLLALSVGCPKPPQPPIPEPPALREVHISLFSEGNLLDARAVRYAALTPHTNPPTNPLDVVPYQDRTAVYRLKAVLPASVQYGWAARLRIELPNYEHFDTDILLAADYDAVFEPADAQLPALVIDGDLFRLSNGQRFYGIEASDFCLFQRFVDEGKDAIRPILQQRRDLGFNMLRVWTQMDLAQFGICRLSSQALSSDWPRFLSFVSRFGLYVDATAYTGPYTGGFDPGHWSRLCAASQGHSNVILSLVNENDQANNHIDTSQFSKCPGVLSSRGSMGAGAWPDVFPLWDFTEYHSNGLSEWQRKVGHEAQEIAWTYHVPVHASENTRFPDNDQSLAHAEDAAKGSALLNAAATFHSVNGKRSQLFTALELEAARAWVKGAKSIPLDCQPLPYMRLDPGAFLRIYQGDNDPRCIAIIRR